MSKKKIRQYTVIEIRAKYNLWPVQHSLHPKRDQGYTPTPPVIQQDNLNNRHHTSHTM